MSSHERKQETLAFPATKGISSHSSKLKQKEQKETREMLLTRLKQWDLDPKYGPCVAIPRLQRWERAQKLGLEPPVWVRDALKQATDTELLQSLWYNDL